MAVALLCTNHSRAAAIGRSTKRRRSSSLPTTALQLQSGRAPSWVLLFIATDPEPRQSAYPVLAVSRDLFTRHSRAAAIGKRLPRHRLAHKHHANPSKTSQQDRELPRRQPRTDTDHRYLAPWAARPPQPRNDMEVSSDGLRHGLPRSTLQSTIYPITVACVIGCQATFSVIYGWTGAALRHGLPCHLQVHIRPTTNYLLLATCYLLFATYYVLLTTYDLLLATCYFATLLLVTCQLTLAICCYLHCATLPLCHFATHYSLLTTRNLLLATCQLSYLLLAHCLLLLTDY